MTWIELPADDATPELERATRSRRTSPTGLAHVVGILKPNPRALRAVMQMNQAVTFGGSSLGRRREELISSTVSALNDCFY